mgnify:CR=1 FL=1
MKPKHWYRLASLISGIALIVLGLVDGKINYFAFLDAEWLLVAGVVLVAAGARKLPDSIGGKPG